MRKVNGSGLVLFAKIEGQYRTLAFATNHTLNITASESSDSSDKDATIKPIQETKSGWATSQTNQMSFEISTESLMSADNDKDNGYWDLFDIMKNGDTVDVIFGETLESLASCFYGKGFDMGEQGYWSVPKKLGLGASASYIENGAQGLTIAPTTGTSGTGTTSKVEADYYVGKVTITALNLTSGTGANATYSATLTGQGELKHEKEEVTFKNA